MEPIYVTMILCQGATVLEGGGCTFNVTGGFIGEIARAGADLGEIELQLLIAFATDAIATGEHVLAISIVDGNGQEEDLARLHFSPPIKPTAYCKVLLFNGFIPFGEYHLRASIDGKRVNEMPLSVVRDDSLPVRT